MSSITEVHESKVLERIMHELEMLRVGINRIENTIDDFCIKFEIFIDDHEQEFESK